jgi:pimeloyl-ACP methyl ester carboxylesterase
MNNTLEQEMTSPRVDSIACANPLGLHRMAYYDWGDPDNGDVVLCVHGLTRNGRDFDPLAEHLCSRYRVICPDIVGRGLSDWLAQPLGYVIPQYVSDLVTLLGRLRPKTLRWVGTSMGGLIAMTYAGLVMQAAKRVGPMPPARLTACIADPIVPLTKLVLNDVGPRVETVSLARIGQYLSEPVSFDSFAQAVQYMQRTAAAFGPHSDEQWALLTRHYFVVRNGQWVKHYDPGIAMPFAGLSQEMAGQGEQMLWHAFESFKAPTLILRGENSDLLSKATVERMVSLNPRARAIELAGVGHAPSLMIPSQMQCVAEFLNEQD